MSWLLTGVVHGTVAFAAAWLLALTVLRRAHPATRAALFALVLLKFLVPFGPTLKVPPVEALSPTITGTRQVVATRASEAPTDVLMTAWLAGVLGLGVVRVMRHVRHRRALGTRAISPEAHARLGVLSRRLGMRRMPRAVESERGPGLVGLLNPVLVVPPGATGLELDAMLTHELAHLRRRDPVVRLFQVVVETLFFFWPIVRLASRQLDLAREQACDLTVLEASSISATGYAELLLAQGQSPRPQLAMTPHPTQLERRITMVLDVSPSTRPARRWLSLAAFAALATVGSGLSFAATPPSSTPGIPPKVDGSLDPRVVQTVIATNAYQVEACFQSYLKDHPKTEGVLVLHWSVKDDGTVDESCQSHGTTIPMELGRCVSNRVSSWSFPSPGFGQRASVEYTFEFTSKTR